jgi:CheY-like chemotaxis protein
MSRQAQRYSAAKTGGTHASSFSVNRLTKRTPPHTFAATILRHLWSGPLSLDVDPGRSLILVVDDDASIRSVIVDVLASEGYATDSASNGIEALTRIEATSPALVLLDLRMPVRTGVELLHDLRERGWWPGIPVVPMSAGLTLVEQLKREFSAFADGPFLQKPFDLDDLLDTVATIVAPPPTSTASSIS